MKFRRLYWVTEQLDEFGCSEIVGVFTSIPDLIEDGLKWNDGFSKKDKFRLTLVKLDSKKRPLGTWISPDYEGFETDIQEYVETKEFTTTECESLVAALKAIPV